MQKKSAILKKKSNQQYGSYNYTNKQVTIQGKSELK